MSTYALFIATNPEPVSSSEWSSLEQVYERARLSSGGTKVQVRSTESGGDDAGDFETDVATFVNGIQLEVRDDGPTAFSYLGDGRVLGTAALRGGEWHLTAAPGVPVPDSDDVALIADAGRSRREVEVALGKFVEDWLA